MVENSSEDSGVDIEPVCYVTKMLKKAREENVLPELMQSIEEQCGLPCIKKGKPAIIGPWCSSDTTYCFFLQDTPEVLT